MTQNFGGQWTQDKLKALKKYLKAYTTIMSKYAFNFAYIDAFAGSGYIRFRKEEQNTDENLTFQEFFEEDTRAYIQGSAKIALDVHPPFKKYIFIEKNPENCVNLEKLKTEYPDKKIDIFQEDANEYLLRSCKMKWEKHRAVVFLDPYGMQVPWETIKAIAKTEAIDLWLLFPLGVAINRLLRRDGNISPGNRKRLNEVFGDTDWHEAFYKTDTNIDIFGETETIIKKKVDFDGIKRYFVQKLRTIFKGVSEPLELLSSTNNPLYLFCCASANQTAIKIANDILGKRRK